MMDSQKPSSGAPARKELQGSRPSPLKICRDSRKIRKPAPAVAPAVPTMPMMNRSEPMIIYMQSPKIIHAEVEDFMTLVQRLTGSSNNSDHQSTVHQPSGAATTSYEPAASVENTAMSTTSRDFVNKEIGTRKASSEPEDNEHGLPAPATCAATTSAALSSVSPNFLFPSPRGINFSPTIFQDLPLMTPNSDDYMYTPRDFYRFAEPLFSPPQRPPLNTLTMLQSPSATALDLCNNIPEH